MKTGRALLLAGAIISATAPAFAAEKPACAGLRMADPGWTDITSTNALLGLVLKPLGYAQKVEPLAVPVTYEAIKNGQLDAFLGNWMPAQKRFVEPLVASGDLEVIRANLDGIRFTLAVPKYVADMGVKSFADLAAHGDAFDHKIYGIEPGAPANQNIQKMLDAKDFGLTGWSLVESSEQAMLSQVDRAQRGGKAIVFLAWEPHPMNTKFELTYLAGGDAYFGANFGAATVYTVARKGFAADCPNLARLLGQLTFTVDIENQIMAAILDGGEDAGKAALAALKAHPGLVDAWLAGVTTKDGADGRAAVKANLGL